MTEVLHSSNNSPSLDNTPSHKPTLPFPHSFLHNNNDDDSISMLTVADVIQEQQQELEHKEEKDKQQLSLLAILLALFRKSFSFKCKTDRDHLSGTNSMEIGWPTDVEHVNHVTFDRFDGFLGLPVEFEPEISRRPPSASTTVFGVSTESMQLSYDNRGNSIPTILLLMQKHLYSRGGLQVEGIFRITAGNGQEEYVRDQLNRGVVPDGIDVHCLGGLIKAWFRELPRGILDPLSPESVMQCQSEEDCVALVRLLPQTEAALLDWAINLMADVVQQQHHNKMHARNIAMVFAPNMTQMADPLSALMYAVQVMNFLKTLIEKTLREREEHVQEPSIIPNTESSDDNGNENSSRLDTENTQNENNVTDDDFYSTCADESDASGLIEATTQVCRIPCPEEAGAKSSIQNQSLLSDSSPSEFEWVNPKNKGVSSLTNRSSTAERYEVLR